MICLQLFASPLRAPNFITRSSGESMRYLLLFIAIYFVIKFLRRMLSNFKIVDADSNEVKAENADSPNRLMVDESDIEDADFKEVD